MKEIINCAKIAPLQLLSQPERESKLNLRTEVIANNEAVVIYCSGRLVYRDEAAVLSRAVERILPRAQQVVLEMSEVEAIDSAGLGSLLNILHMVRASRRCLRLAAPNRRTLNLLQLTKLDSVFEIHPALDDALMECRGQLA
jgi:anti-sigma B factor antagonist